MRKEHFLFSCADFPQAHGTLGSARSPTYYLIAVVTEFIALPLHSAKHFFFLLVPFHVFKYAQVFPILKNPHLTLLPLPALDLPSLVIKISNE